MRKMDYKNFIAVSSGFLLMLSLSNSLLAGDSAETKTDPIDFSLTADPARYTFIDGDSSKFRALHWMDDGFAFGVKDFKLNKEFSNDVSLESEGHVIPEDGDYSGSAHFKKDDIAYLNFDYSEFRKYYSNAGGLYRPFVNLAQNYTDKELALNIGKFGVEAGLSIKNMPDITLDYERDFKEGTKSRLSWASVTDNAPGVGASTVRKIAPSWQQIDEITDSFGAKLDDTVAGFNWNAEQRWEFTRANDMREEKQLDTVVSGSPDANAKIRDLYQSPRTDLLTTLLGVNRWFWKEKIYVSGDYRFSQVDSHELDNLNELTGNGVLHNFANPKQWVNAFADNHYISQTGVMSFMTTLLNPITAITRFKVEAINRRSESTTPQDISPAVPDGSIDQIDVANNQDKRMSYGESVSFRYGGIPHVSIYNDYDFQQVRDDLYMNLTSASAATTLNRQELDHMYRGSGTLGAQIFPLNHVTLTAQVRHKLDDIHYNHLFNNGGDTSLTFIDKQSTATDEFETRVSWKPVRWFQPTFRYQLQDKRYTAWGLPNDDVSVGTALISNIYTWDLSSQPVDDLLLTASFSFQDGKIITPDRSTGLASAIPTFNFDSYTTLFSAEYALTKDIILTGTADYIRAANFQDFSIIGMPYGADFHQVDLTLGCSWKLNKDLSLEPKYSWYQYSANEAEIGSYNAHTFWLEAKINWG